MKTYSVVCPLCPVWIEDAITMEHMERALLQHIDTEHPRWRLIARHVVSEGLPSPLALFDSIETPDDETTTCVVCGASITIEPADPESSLLQSFKNDHVTQHVTRHADVIQEEERA